MNSMQLINPKSTVPPNMAQLAVTDISRQEIPPNIMRDRAGAQVSIEELQSINEEAQAVEKACIERINQSSEPFNNKTIDRAKLLKTKIEDIIRLVERKVVTLEEPESRHEIPCHPENALQTTNLLRILKADLQTRLALTLHIEGDFDEAHYHIYKSESDLRSCKFCPVLILVEIEIVNRIAWCYALPWGNLTQSRMMFHASESHYHKVQSSSALDLYEILEVYQLCGMVEGRPTSSQDIKGNVEKVLGKAYISTLRGLGTVAENLDVSSLYAHKYLKEQLNRHSYNPFEWALCAARLSEYYVAVKKNFSYALHCLASSMKMLNETDENGLLPTPENRALILKFWVKYAAGFINFNFSFRSRQAGSELSKDGIEPEKFDINCPDYETWMISKQVKTLDELKPLFRKAREFISEAKEVLTVKDHPTSYVELELGHCYLWEGMIWGERDTERKSKMMKRKADVLEDLIVKAGYEIPIPMRRVLLHDLANLYHGMYFTKRFRTPLNTQTANNKQSRLHKLSKLNMKVFTVSLVFLSTYCNRNGKLTEVPGSVTDVLRAKQILDYIYLAIQNQVTSAATSIFLPSIVHQF